MSNCSLVVIKWYPSVYRSQMLAKWSLLRPWHWEEKHTVSVGCHCEVFDCSIAQAARRSERMFWAAWPLQDLFLPVSFNILVGCWHGCSKATAHTMAPSMGHSHWFPHSSAAMPQHHGRELADTTQDYDAECSQDTFIMVKNVIPQQVLLLWKLPWTIFVLKVVFLNGIFRSQNSGLKISLFFQHFALNLICV